MYLADEAWPDLESYFESESLALIPLGSTEQHGPHLPEGTDHIIAESFARAAAAETGYLCTPTINIGVSPHHRQVHGLVDGDALGPVGVLRDRFVREQPLAPVDERSTRGHTQHVAAAEVDPRRHGFVVQGLLDGLGQVHAPTHPPRGA